MFDGVEDGPEWFNGSEKTSLDQVGKE